MAHIRSRAALALALALLLAASVPATVAAGVGDGEALQESVQAQNDTVDPADEIYVDEEGNGVLVYESDAEDVSGEYGLDTATGLVYILLDGENVTDEEVETELLVTLEADEVAGSGFVRGEAPEDLRALELEVSGEQSSETAELDARLRAEVATDPDEAVGAPETESARASGSIRTTTDRVQVTGEVSAGTEVPPEQQQRAEVSFQGQGGDYTLEVVRERTVPEFQASRWDTEANATESLRAQFAPVGQTVSELGGQQDVELTDYAYDEDTNELRVEYTVSMRGIEAEPLAELLRTDGQSVDEETEGLSQAEAQQLADGLLGVEFRTLEASVDARADAGVDLAWNVDVRNLEPLAETGFELTDPADLDVEELDEEALEERFQEARDRYEAASETGYAQTMTWELALEGGEEVATVDAEVSYEAENRAAYLEAIDAEPMDVTYEFDAELEDAPADAEAEQFLNTSGSVTVADSELLDDAVDESVTAILEDEATDQRAARLLEAIQAANLETARAELAVRDGDVSLEAAGLFEDASAFEDVLSEEFGGESVTHVYGEADGEAETYVYVEGLVGPDASEADVRGTAVADADTTVYLAEDWDPEEEEFPRLDTDAPANYLGVDVAEETETEEDGAGFGAALALLAALLSALLLRRRTR